MSSAITDTASTYGWDTVFAMHIADVNRAIMKAGTTPPGFEVIDAQDNIAATGEFGTWQIIPGGDGDMVRMGIPIQNTVITGLSGGTVRIPSALCHVDIRLDYLRDASTSGAEVHHLKVRTTPGPGGKNAAVVAKVVFPDPPPGFWVKAAVPELLEAWLNENLGDFDHVFATINVNSRADKAQFQWLMPTDRSYAYSDLGTPGDGALAVLCMTRGRPSTGLIQQLSSVAIPGSQRAGFLISKERMLAELVLPAMPNVFKGTQPWDFQLSPTGDAIVNANQDVKFTVTDDHGTQHTAQLMSLSVRIEGGELQMDVQTKTDVSPGIRAFCHTQNYLKIGLVNKPDGTQTLGFSDSRPAQVNHWTDSDHGFGVAEEILAVVAVVAMLVAIVATAGTATVAVALIIGLVAGVAGSAILLATTVSDMVDKNDAPAIDAMVVNSTAPIVWADSGDFHLDSAQLSDSLQLGGSPQLS